MKNSDLIKKLQELPDNLEVTIFDWEKNMKEGEASSKGIYADFDIELIDNDSEKRLHDKFIALSFENLSYKKIDSV